MNGRQEWISKKMVPLIRGESEHGKAKKKTESTKGRCQTRKKKKKKAAIITTP